MVLGGSKGWCIEIYIFFLLNVLKDVISFVFVTLSLFFPCNAGLIVSL